MGTLTTVSGVNYALSAATPPTMLAPQESFGVIKHKYDSYSKSASDEFGTSGLIRMMTIPKGARVVNAIFACTNTGGSTGQCEIGWAAGATGTVAADADGLFTTQTLTSAITGTHMVSTVEGWNKTFAEEVEVQIDFTQATNAGVAADFELSIFYVQN